MYRVFFKFDGYNYFGMSLGRNVIRHLIFVFVYTWPGRGFDRGPEPSRDLSLPTVKNVQFLLVLDSIKRFEPPPPCLFTSEITHSMVTYTE